MPITFGPTGRWYSLEKNKNVFASGGTVSTTEANELVYRVHTFTNVGVNTFTVNHKLTDVEYLVVAGGANGGTSSFYVGGRGGGAGGFRTSVRGALSGRNSPAEPTLNIDPGEVSVVVGGANQDSSFSTITSLRGGVGSGSGGTGGSGGSGTAGQGYAGGIGNVGSPSIYKGAGGGGGAGGAGSNCSFNTGGCSGGSGLTSNITGTNVTYSRGGNSIGAGIFNFGSPTGSSGAANSGDGGSAGQSTGGTGGSGIVIVRYPIGVVGQ